MPCIYRGTTIGIKSLFIFSGEIEFDCRVKKAAPLFDRITNCYIVRVADCEQPALLIVSFHV
jgi:hypothetical protein